MTTTTRDLNNTPERTRDGLQTNKITFASFALLCGHKKPTRPMPIAKTRER